MVDRIRKRWEAPGDEITGPVDDTLKNADEKAEEALKRRSRRYVLTSILLIEL